MQAKPLYQEMASLLLAMQNCRESGNIEWCNRHESRLLDLVKNHLPSGSGFDGGTSIDIDASSPDRLIFDTAFHHMNESGYYDGWTGHSVIVKPSLAFGFELRITGQDRNYIKDYIVECFHATLSESRDWREEYRD